MKEKEQEGYAPALPFLLQASRLRALLGVSESRRGLLPDEVAWHRIEGGNHSQLGWYGTQLGDGTARITRVRQHDEVVAAVLAMLGRVGAMP